MARAGKLLGVGVFALIYIGVFWYTGSVPVPVAEAQVLSEEEKTKLQAELDRLQQEIDQWQGVLNETRAKKGTLQGDVTLLNAQIKKAETEIKQRNVTINTISNEI